MRLIPQPQRRHSGSPFAILLLSLIALGSYPSPVLAKHPAIPSCQFFFKPLAPPEFDSSIEIEMSTIPQVLRLLTTPDGKLSGLIKAHSTPLTPELIQPLLEAFPQYRNRVDQIPWDKVSPEMQRKLVAFFHQGQSFSQSRKIRGIVLKEFVPAHFSKPTTLFGSTYTPGTHTIPLRKILRGGDLEFMSPEAIRDFSGIEAHLRQKVNPSANLSEARDLLNSLGITPPSMHQHVVGRFNLKTFQKNPRLEVTRMIEYHRRVNLYNHMLVILERKPLEKIREGNTLFFSPLSQKGLQDDADELQWLAHDYDVAKNSIPDRNMAYVSLRLPATYDGTEPLIGMEFRLLSHRAPESRQVKMRRLMDSAQYSLKHQDYGIPKEAIERWIQANDPDPKSSSFDENLASWLYPESAFSSAAVQKNLSLTESPSMAQIQKINTEVNSNWGLGMLFHDWSKDPILFENPEALKRVLEIQQMAVRRFNAGEKPADSLRYFVQKSGLFQTFEKSLGI